MSGYELPAGKSDWLANDSHNLHYRRVTAWQAARRVSRIDVHVASPVVPLHCKRVAEPRYLTNENGI